MSWDVLVVGGGSAGCTLAGRLSEDPGRRVLLLEAGSAVSDPAAFPAEVRDVSSLAACDPDGPHTWDVGVELTAGRRTRVGRGRLLGGSSAVNGANHLRATRADLDSWSGWSFDATLPYYVRGERDLDMTGPLHGDAGPVPVVRPAGELRAAVTERFLAAAARTGVPPEIDKNGDRAPGAGLVPANVRRGVRVNAAMAYVLPHLDRPNLTVRGDVTVARVLLDGDRAVGVEGADGERIEAGEVVLSAGSVCTPQLLAHSGIGPPDALRAAGLPVRHERPGVGRGYSDHPSVYLAFPSPDPEGIHPEAPGAQAAVHLDAGADPAGDLEILLFARPFAPGGPCHLMCALQAPESRGAMTFSADPRTPPRLEHRYLASGHDRARMRQVVRRAGELLAAGGLALGPTRTPGGTALDDRDLDAWITAHLGTSAHLCGSARIGPADDPLAVVDPELRVHGLRGLRVVDTSVLPTVPRRGPAATALMLGERAADLLAGRTLAEVARPS
ncbi:mycofactocin system GMC family oxidoreductase MftG [Actinomycetospora lutea]|uniref:mycofactocin dehydrogenase MftG n=1 Tax=Actinomycetospora lutea TaxID=663604 RepID=UPI00236738F6|nr:mycofactocin system GMC family oxidoreductase MftG [Actinomycetospora lutea]MDD7937656.1 mycofactocin system GMC family oxidoreductase MftG [Actinomycetospora lutea]